VIFGFREGQNSPGTVSVVDGILGNLVNVELLDLNLAVGGSDADNSGLSTLGDNGNTGALGVLLGEQSKLLSDLNNVLGAPLVAGSVGTSLGLVTECVIGVGQNGIQLLLEELGDEGSGEREHEDLLACE